MPCFGIAPLSHSYPLLEYLGDVTEDHEFWMRQDLPVLRRCNELLILGLPDWERSRGVKDELFTALSMNIPVTLIEEDDIDALPVIPKSARQFLKSNILQTAEEES